MNIDNEWLSFLSNKKNKNTFIVEEEEEDTPQPPKHEYYNKKSLADHPPNAAAPLIGPLKISTKSKIGFLNVAIDLKDVFWKIEVAPYHTLKECVIKKQIKYVSSTPEELEEMQARLHQSHYYIENIITSINNPAGRIKFKDIRKLTVGISKKDILAYRSKTKSAFYNCMVIIVRCLDEEFADQYKEYHVKIFNTGKLKVPGVPNDSTYYKIVNFVVDLLTPFVNDAIAVQNKNKTILVNSNFNCGFYINQEKFYDILKFKYNIQCIYDPCSYPGIQCKFYYDSDKKDMSGIQQNTLTLKENKKSENNSIVSFMIFRTGSVLIVGLCDDELLNNVYNFIKDILIEEYDIIATETQPMVVKNKNKKTKKRWVGVAPVAEFV
jgi:hypothetical protein